MAGNPGHSAVCRSVRRAWFPRSCGFWLSAPVLIVALLCELVYSVALAVLFPLFRARERARFAELLTNPPDGSVRSGC